MSRTEMYTLSARKMEKNFIAHLEKGYKRKPQEYYPIEFWIDRIKQELKELEEASEQYDYDGVLDELADISNLVDYAFETVMVEYIGDLCDEARLDNYFYIAGKVNKERMSEGELS